MEPILLSTDVDDCLIPWENRKRNGAFDEAALQKAITLTQNNPQLIVHWNTGRNLTSLKTLSDPAHPIHSLLAQMRLDYLSTNNGQELYVHQDQCPTTEWIASLQDADTDPAWTCEIERRTGWNLCNVISFRETWLLENGFHEMLDPLLYNQFVLPAYTGLRVFVKQEDEGNWITVQCFDNQPGYRISELDLHSGHQAGMQAKHSGKTLQKAIQDGLKQDTNTETILGNKPMLAGNAHLYSFTLFPVGVNKGAVVDILLARYCPDAQAVITAGDDAYNDLDLLSPDQFNLSIRPILNYPVVVGEHDQVRQAVSQNPRHEYVPLGGWDSGVQHQLDKIV